MKTTTLAVLFAAIILPLYAEDPKPALTEKQKLTIRDAQVAYLAAKAAIDDAKAKAEEKLKALSEVVTKVGSEACKGCQVTQDQKGDLIVVVAPAQ